MKKTKNAYYDHLHEFRKEWEAAGGSRGSLRKARKQQKTLFPSFKKEDK